MDIFDLVFEFKLFKNNASTKFFLILKLLKNFIAKKQYFKV